MARTCESWETMMRKFPVTHLKRTGPEMVIDSFAGGGGASVGIERALGRSPDVA